MEKRYIVIISFAFLFILSALLVYAASFPTNGQPNWGTPLNECWNVLHNNDCTFRSDVLSKIPTAAGVTDIVVGSAQLGPAVVSGGNANIAVTVTGIDTTNDVAWCKITYGTDVDNVFIGGISITSANTVTVTLVNPTAASVQTENDDTLTCIGFKRP